MNGWELFNDFGGRRLPDLDMEKIEKEWRKEFHGETERVETRTQEQIDHDYHDYYHAKYLRYRADVKKLEEELKYKKAWMEKIEKEGIYTKTYKQYKKN